MAGGGRTARSRCSSMARRMAGSGQECMMMQDARMSAGQLALEPLLVCSRDFRGHCEHE